MVGLLPEILIKQPRESEYGELYQEWRVERSAKFEQWQPPKLDWKPDPKYNQRFLTIKAARGWYNPVKQPIWFIIGCLMFFSWAFWDLTLMFGIRRLPGM